MVKIYIYKVQLIQWLHKSSLNISIIYLQIYRVCVKLFELTQIKILIKWVKFNTINHKYTNHVYIN